MGVEWISYPALFDDDERLILSDRNELHLVDLSVHKQLERCRDSRLLAAWNNSVDAGIESRLKQRLRAGVEF